MSQVLRARRARIALAFAALASVALATACGSGGGSAAGGGSTGGTTAVKVAYIPIYSVGAIQLGVDQGFFAQHGLELELQQVANPPAGIAAVAGGGVNFTYTPSIPLLNAAAGGVKLKVVTAADGYAQGTVAKVKADRAAGEKFDDTAVVAGANSGITRPAELAGKTVSVPARKAQLEVTIADAVKKDGGDPSTIKWITLDFPSSVSSLKSGRVDASGLVAPFISQATKGGGKVVSSPGVTFFGDGAVGLWTTSADYADSHSEQVQAFQQAVEQTNAYANNHVADEQAAAAKVLKTDVSTVKEGSQPYFPTSVSAESLQQAATQMKNLGYLTNQVDISSLLYTAGK